MDLSAGSMWVIYLVATLIPLVIFFLWVSYQVNPENRSYCYLMAAMFSFLIGAVAVAIATAWLNFDELDDNEKTWLIVLYVLMVLILVVLGIVILRNRYNKQGYKFQVL